MFIQFQILILMGKHLEAYILRQLSQNILIKLRITGLSRIISNFIPI